MTEALQVMGDASTISSLRSGAVRLGLVRFGRLCCGLLRYGVEGVTLRCGPLSFEGAWR
jgi:hypothetical protein